MNFTIKYWSNLNPVSGLRRALSFIILLSFFSCDNDPSNLGSSLLPAEDSVAMMLEKDFTITGYTISPKSYYSRDVDTFLIGELKNDIFGEVTASSIFEFSPRLNYYPQEDSITEIGQPYLLLYPAGNLGMSVDGQLPVVNAYEITGNFDTLAYSYSTADLALLEKTLLNNDFSTDSNSLIKINLPRAYSDKYLKPYINYDSVIIEVNANTELADTFNWGIKFNEADYKNSLNPILIKTTPQYYDYITKISGINSSIIFPVKYSNGSETSLRYYLSELNNGNFNANYFSYKNSNSNYTESIDDTLTVRDNIYLQAQRAQAKIVIDGLEELKNSLSNNVLVYKASLTIPVSDVLDNTSGLIPGRISLKFYDNTILPDDPQTISSLVSTLYLSRFDGAYYEGIHAYKFDISLYVEAFLNGVIDKNEFLLFIPDNIITTFDNSNVLDTIIQSKNKAEMVALKNGNDAVSPIKLDVFYTTVDK